MKPYAEKFYKSAAWRKCRANYYKQAGGLCEACKAKGLITPGEIVHHKEFINPWNIQDPNVLLAFDNLELLCRKHHAERHGEEIEARYTVDEYGRVTPL